MTNRTNTPDQLDTPPIPVQAKLAAAWTSFMFLYVYVDILALYKPGVVDGILVVASLQVPFAAFNAVGELGEPWMYFYVLGVALEVVVLAFILRSAWAWPRRTASPSTSVPEGRPAPQQA